MKISAEIVLDHETGEPVADQEALKFAQALRDWLFDHPLTAQVIVDVDLES